MLYDWSLTACFLQLFRQFSCELVVRRKPSSNNFNNKKHLQIFSFVDNNQCCTGSYEAAVESGAHKAIEMRRTKRILKIRKQDSYTRAIGGSFEDEHSRSEARKERTGMKKQDSYLRAVGEVSPDSESKSDFSSISEINIRKQDSYIEAIRLLGVVRFSDQYHVQINLTSGRGSRASISESNNAATSVLPAGSPTGSPLCWRASNIQVSPSSAAFFGQDTLLHFYPFLQGGRRNLVID